MVEELKLAIKIDDDAIEQSLLKQFNNAEKMADKVVLTFKNVDLDDKNIKAKFKEIQKMAGKNPIDFSINDGRTTERLSAISKQLSNIFEIAKGKSLIDSSSTISEINKIANAAKDLKKAENDVRNKSYSTKNKTEAYNQLKQTADIFKNFYGNEEAMHSKAGTDAAYAYYKAYEEALQKGVAQSKLEKVTVDAEADGFYNANRLSSDRIKEFDNFKNFGGDITNLSLEISDLEQRLLKFRDAYSQVESNLGEAPITPEIIKNIENYVRALEVAENRTKDADLFGFTKEGLESDKDYANMYLGFALEDATRENEKYVSSLQEVREEKEKTDEVLNRSSTSTINDSQFDELKADVIEIREELNGVKEKISVIDSDGFENIKSDVEKTTGSVKELNSELTELKSKVGDKSNISSENTSVSSTAISEESNALDKVSNSANEASVAKEKFANANKEVKESAESSSNAIKNEGMKLGEVEKSIEKYHAYFKQFSNNFDDRHRFPDFNSNLTDMNTKIQELESLRDNLRIDDNGFIDTDDVKKINALIKEIDGLVVSAKQFPQALRGWKDVAATNLAEKFNQALEDNPRLSRVARDEIQALYNELVSGNPSRPLGEMKNRLNEIIQSEREAGRAGKNWLDIFKDKKIYGFLGQAASMFSFYDLINVGKQATSIVTELNTQITDLAKVSEATSKQIYADFDSYADIAKDIGGTISDTISATADWGKNGYSIPDAKELARVSQLYKNVGDGIDIDSANESLISTLKGFQLEAEQAEHIVDVFNEVSNNEAITSSGIGEALQRSAASFNAANTSLEKSVALVSATNSVLQDPEKVGNMWRTVSARIRGAETELQEAGLETEGMVESTSKLQALIKGMTGFDILESDGKTFKDIYEIVLNIGKEWENLSDIDQAALLEALAGKQQSNALAAALSNIDILEKSYKEATNAVGSASEEQLKYSQSVQYSIDRTKASLEELANDFLSSDFLKGLIDSGDKLINLLDLLIDKFGVLGTLGLGASAYLGFTGHGLTNYVTQS